MVSSEIEKLIKHFSALPGLGPRSARKAVLSLLEDKERRLQSMIDALELVEKKVQKCRLCGNLDSQNPCVICNEVDRRKDVICIVETVADLWTLEKSSAYRGQYQILGGVLSPLMGVTPEKLNIDGLKLRLEKKEIKEVIFALGATVEGATTAHWLCETLIGDDVKVSRLGQGMPIGGTLENLDDGTLMAAFSARKTF